MPIYGAYFVLIPQPWEKKWESMFLGQRSRNKASNYTIVCTFGRDDTGGRGSVALKWKQKAAVQIIDDCMDLNYLCRVILVAYIVRYT